MNLDTFKLWGVRFCITYTILNLAIILFFVITNDGAKPAC